MGDICCGYARYLIFGLESGKSVILEREQTISEGPNILKDHAIAFDRSSDIPLPPGTLSGNGSRLSGTMKMELMEPHKQEDDVQN